MRMLKKVLGRVRGVVMAVAVAFAMVQCASADTNGAEAVVSGLTGAITTGTGYLWTIIGCGMGVTFIFIIARIIRKGGKGFGQG